MFFRLEVKVDKIYRNIEEIIYNKDQSFNRVIVEKILFQKDLLAVEDKFVIIIIKEDK